jgi:hypothetical protein
MIRMNGIPNFQASCEGMLHLETKKNENDFSLHSTVGKFSSLQLKRDFTDLREKKHKFREVKKKI